jgi:hypothetical protein
VSELMNVLLTEDGQRYQYPHIDSGRSLVIDIGGFTTCPPAMSSYVSDNLFRGVTSSSGRV